MIQGKLEYIADAGHLQVDCNIPCRKLETRTDQQLLYRYNMTWPSEPIFLQLIHYNIDFHSSPSLKATKRQSVTSRQRLQHSNNRPMPMSL
jgi:hypothetical protein